ncbi:hypothetical protein [Nonomuraea sp. JJY05]|uniref:hypothetical protein n=1 Tax=Nonomuraea sp. JJY05 TaxID=3350255 RepID=UPI00373F7890
MAALLPRLLRLPDGTIRTHGPLFLSERRPVPAQLIMGKTRHKNPRTAMRYVKPGAEAIAAVTAHLAPPRRTH